MNNDSAMKKFTSYIAQVFSVFIEKKLDAKWLILINIVLNILLWSSKDLTSSIFAFLLVIIFFVAIKVGISSKELQIRLKRKNIILKAFSFFIIYWVATDLLMSLIFSFNSFGIENIKHSLILAIKLIGTWLIGLILTRRCTPIELSRGIGFWIRPLARKNTINIVMSVALMVNLVSRARTIFDNIKIINKTRLKGLNKVQKYTYLSRKLILMIVEQSYAQQRAIIARNLYRDNIWLIK